MALKSQALSGIKWSSISTAINMFLQFLTLVTLSRLLSPEDFGLLGMVMVIVGFSQSFADMGVGGAIIHKQNSTPEELSTLYYLNIFTGFLLAFFLIIFAPFIASFYHESRLINLIYWISLIFFVIPFGIQFQMLLQKNLSFKMLAIIEITGNFLGAVVSIILAILKFGVLSIILGQIVLYSSKSILFAIQGFSHWRPIRYFNLKEVKDYITFGLYQMGERSITYFGSYLDYLLIGKFLGAETLGYYSIAHQFVTIPFQKLNPILTKVLFPVLAKIQHNNEKLKIAYFTSLKYLVYIIFPIICGIALLARPVVLLFLGEKWLPSVILIQLLALVAIFRARSNPIGSLLLAKGRADLGFKWNVGVLITQFLGILISVQYGVVPVILTVIGLQVIYWLLMYFIIFRNIIGECLKEYFIKTSLIPWAYVAAMSTMVLLFNQIYHTKIIIQIILSIVMGIFSYSLIFLFFEKKSLIEIKSLISIKT